MTPHKIAESLRDDVQDVIYAFKTKRFWRTLIFTVLGTVLFAIAINSILIPFKFLSGGIAGISLIIYYWLNGPSLGLIYWIINIPILILAWRTMSLRYVVICMVGVFATSACLDLTQAIHITITNPILAAILGGVLTGTGCGFYLRYGGSTGGMDVIATMLRRKMGIPIGLSFIGVNMGIVAVNALLFNVDIALYTGIYMFVHSTIIDKVQAGFSHLKAVFIVTDKATDIANNITQVLGRGVTFLYAEGAYAKREKRVLYTVINMIELARLKEILYQIDSQAFVSINDTSEVIGNRFLTWEEQGFEARHAHKKLKVAGS